jgi:hypothetical protein
VAVEVQTPHQGVSVSDPSTQAGGSPQQDFWSVVTSTTAYASQLMSHFRGWGTLAPSAEQASVGTSVP